MDNMYFSAELMGGLGNQMFQIAHAVAQSHRYGTKAIFRPNSSTHMQGKNASLYVDNFYNKINFDSSITPQKVIYENDWSFNYLNINEMIPTTFFGYFQSSKNFYGYDNEIKKLFLPEEKSINDLQEKYPELKQKNNVSLHIRRGDYLNSPSIHPVVSYDYIKKSLELVGNYSNIFLFSDDVNWFKQNFSEYNVIVANNYFDYEDIWMMSLCEANIISNSTFSWWGSFLNKNENKKVIAPSIWFGPEGPKNYKDIYENDWTVIDVTLDNGLLKIL